MDGTGPAGGPGGPPLPSLAWGPRRLTSAQLTRLPTLLARGPEAEGFRGPIWTRTCVAEVICLGFGVGYHPTHVGRLLNAMRWSPQKPMRRAWQRDEAAIAHWHDATWTAMKRGRKPNSRASFA